jgi:hypothetical protein
MFRYALRQKLYVRFRGNPKRGKEKPVCDWKSLRVLCSGFF